MFDTLFLPHTSWNGMSLLRRNISGCSPYQVCWTRAAGRKWKQPQGRGHSLIPSPPSLRYTESRASTVTLLIQIPLAASSTNVQCFSRRFFLAAVKQNALRGATFSCLYFFLIWPAAVGICFSYWGLSGYSTYPQAPVILAVYGGVLGFHSPSLALQFTPAHAVITTLRHVSHAGGSFGDTDDGRSLDQRNGG